MPDIWYQVRKKVGDIAGTLPQGVVGPFFNDEFGDTYGIVYGFTADGFSDRELRDYVARRSHAASRAARRLQGRHPGRPGRAHLRRVLAPPKLAGLGIDRSRLVDALAEPERRDAGRRDPDRRREDPGPCLRRLPLAEGRARTSISSSAAACFASATSPRSRAGYADPPQPMFRVNGKEAIGVAIAMRKGGDVLGARRTTSSDAMAAHHREPAGRHRALLVSNQPKVVENAVDDFMKALWEAIAIVLGVSFLSLGLRAGAVVALSIPLVLADRLPGHAASSASTCSASRSAR